MKAYLKDIWPMDKKRTYSPVYDAKVYNKEAWEKLLDDFNKNVKAGAYNKLLYTDWKVLHLMDGDYKVVWFEINNTCLAPTIVHIQEFKYLKDSDNFRMVGTDKKYNTSEDDYSFGTYLADMLFYDYFDWVEADEKVDDYRLFGLTNLGAYSSEDGIGWRAINWALNPAVEGTTGQAIFNDVKKDIKKLNCEFNKTTEILNNCYNKINENTEWLNKVYENVDKVKNTTFSDTATINVSPIDPAKLDIKDETASTASVSIDWGYRPTASTASSITGESVIGKTIEVNGDSGITYNPYTTATVSICDSLTSRIDTMEERINKLETNNDDVKGKGNNMKMFNFDFGPIKDNDAVRMSPYGLAVKNVNGTYQAYDKKNGEIMDVDIFNFKADNMFFKMPVGIDAIEAGDVIIFNRRPCFVFGFSEQGDVIAIDIAMGEKKTIMPTKSPFGNFSFITKIVSLFDNMMAPPSKDNPLGNMWMFTLLDDNNKSMKDILPMMLLMNGANGMTGFNPMMLYLMSDKADGDKDWLLPMLMMNNFPGKTN
jgi:hypothetical protein